MSTARHLFERQVRLLDAHDLEGLLGQYHEDAVLLRLDRTVAGKAALREHFTAYLARRPKVKEVTDIPGGAQCVFEVSFEREGTEKPVCVAETVVRVYAGDAAG